MQFFVDVLTQIIENRLLSNVNFAIPAPLPENLPHAFYQPWCRLNIILDGSKQITLPLSGGTSRIRLKSGDAFFSLANSWETNSWESAHQVLCVVPRDHYLRFSYYDLTRANEGCKDLLPLHVYHTQRPYGAALRYVVDALGVIALSEETAGKIDLIYGLLNLARTECNNDSSVKQSKATATFARIAVWLENHLHEPLDRKTTAVAFGMNASYLSQLCEKMVGMGFNEYLTGRRMERARSLLLATDLTVYQVASQCGFSSSAHFVKRFHEIHGRTPANFKTVKPRKSDA